MTSLADIFRQFEQPAIAQLVNLISVQDVNCCVLPDKTGQRQWWLTYKCHNPELSLRPIWGVNGIVLMFMPTNRPFKLQLGGVVYKTKPDGTCTFKVPHERGLPVIPGLFSTKPLDTLTVDEIEEAQLVFKYYRDVFCYETGITGRGIHVLELQQVEEIGNKHILNLTSTNYAVISQKLEQGVLEFDFVKTADQVPRTATVLVDKDEMPHVRLNIVEP